MTAGLQFNVSGFLPVPLGTVSSENLFQGSFIDKQKETAGRSSPFPDRGPVAGANIDMPDRLLLRMEFRPGVPDRFADSVRQQIHGAHGFDALRVDGPSAEIIEGFRFEKNSIHDRSPGSL
ncbi:hypothetical protein SDC9_198075 [bioreactor metagenome]|uniref:Uncharacterized protein n=1 Tax=bioreactor metagenome TaxID=1076179 RepID=A0A645IGL5_9ZZZZ